MHELQHRRDDCAGIGFWLCKPLMCTEIKAYTIDGTCSQHTPGTTAHQNGLKPYVKESMPGYCHDTYDADCPAIYSACVNTQGDVL